MRNYLVIFGDLTSIRNFSFLIFLFEFFILSISVPTTLLIIILHRKCHAYLGIEWVLTFHSCPVKHLPLSHQMHCKVLDLVQILIIFKVQFLHHISRIIVRLYDTDIVETIRSFWLWDTVSPCASLLWLERFWFCSCCISWGKWP